MKNSIKTFLIFLISFLAAFSVFAQGIGRETDYFKTLKLASSGTELANMLTNSFYGPLSDLFFAKGSPMAVSGMLNVSDEATFGSNLTAYAAFFTNGISLGAGRTSSGAAPLLFYEPPADGSDFVALKAPTLSAPITLVLPPTVGSSGQFLQTDGAGNTSWQTASGGGGTWGTITGTLSSQADLQTVLDSKITSTSLDSFSELISQVGITGTPDGTKFLRDDGSFQAIPGGGDALTSSSLAQFASTTSAELYTLLSDEVGGGTGAKAVFSLFPTILNGITLSSNSLTYATLATTPNGLLVTNDSQAASIYLNSDDVEVFGASLTAHTEILGDGIRSTSFYRLFTNSTAKLIIYPREAGNDGVVFSNIVNGGSIYLNDDIHLIPTASTILYNDTVVADSLQLSTNNAGVLTSVLSWTPTTGGGWSWTNNAEGVSFGNYAGDGNFQFDGSSFTFNTGLVTADGFEGPINGSVGATTPTTGVFTTLQAGNSLTLSSNSFSIYWVQDGVGQWTLYDDAGPSADMRISDQLVSFLGNVSFTPQTALFDNNGSTPGSFYLAGGDGTYQGEFRAPVTMVSDKVWTMPDVTGTVALNSSDNAFTGNNTHAGTETFTGFAKFDGTARSRLSLGTISGAYSVSGATNAYSLTASGDSTMTVTSIPASGYDLVIDLYWIENGTGGYTNSFYVTPANGWPEIRTTAGEITHLWYETFDNGTTWYAFSDYSSTGGSGITSINSDTTAAQTITSGTSGTDVAVSTSGGTTTINIPTASASNRGALSTADWSTFNGKVATTRTLTVAGTANEITSSAGAQDLSANRTWTLSLPTALTFTGKTVTGGTFASPTFSTSLLGGTDAYIQFDLHSSAPSAPSAGNLKLYAAADGHLHQLQSDSTDIDLTSTGSGFGETSLAGLANNQTLWDGASASRTLTFDLTGTDPVMTFSSGTINVSTGVLQVNGSNVPTVGSTDTLTNKRITQRVGSTTSSATPTINTDNIDIYKLTAQAVDITSFTTNLSGTPVDGDALEIRVTGTAARAITWGASFVAGPVALPTTTVTTKTLRVYFEWDSVVGKWVCMYSGSDA